MLMFFKSQLYDWVGDMFEAGTKHQERLQVRLSFLPQFALIFVRGDGVGVMLTVFTDLRYEIDKVTYNAGN